MDRRSPSRWHAATHAVEVYSLGAAVSMEDRGVHPPAAASGNPGRQRAHDQGGVVVVAHRVAEQVPRCQVDHRRQVQPALVGGDVGHIPAPGHVRPVGVEQAPDQVGGGRCGHVRLGEAAPAARTVPDDAVRAHQPLHPLAIDPLAAAAQLGMHPRRPVGAMRVGVDDADLCDQLGVGLLGR